MPCERKLVLHLHPKRKPRSPCQPQPCRMAQWKGDQRDLLQKEFVQCYRPQADTQGPHPELHHPVVKMQIGTVKHWSLPWINPFALQTRSSAGCSGLLKNSISSTPQKSSVLVPQQLYKEWIHPEWRGGNSSPGVFLHFKWNSLFCPPQ